MSDPNTQLAVQVRHDLQRMATEFEAVLPPQIPTDRFVRTAITAVSMQPDLLRSDRRSLLGACMKAAQDGLLPDGREAALVMFKGKAQYMPMVAGLLKKARQSGVISSISAHVVYERDQFDYQLGDDEHIIHKPLITGERGKPVAVYAIARTTDGGAYREVMSVAQVEKVRAVSRASKPDSPWNTWWDEMARKTVIRRLAKYMPSSSDLDQLLAREAEPDAPVQQVTVAETASQLEPVDTITDLNRQIAAQAKAAPVSQTSAVSAQDSDQNLTIEAEAASPHQAALDVAVIEEDPFGE